MRLRSTSRLIKKVSLPAGEHSTNQSFSESFLCNPRPCFSFSEASFLSRQHNFDRRYNIKRKRGRLRCLKDPVD